MPRLSLVGTRRAGAGTLDCRAGVNAPRESRQPSSSVSGADDEIAEALVVTLDAAMIGGEVTTIPLIRERLFGAQVSCPGAVSR